MQGLKRVSVVLFRMTRTSSCQNGQWRSKILECTSQMETNSHKYCTAVNQSSECSIDDRLKDPRVASLLEVVVGEGIRPIDLLDALEKSPALLNKSQLQWENSFKELKSYGFTHRDCFSMISEYPDLITLVEGKGFRVSMVQWINLQLGYENVLDLLAYCPHYLSISGSELSSRIPVLYSLGRLNGKNITRLLKNCPSLLYGNWKDTEAKLDYVMNIMKIDTKEENLSKCYMFNRTLDEIQTRHVFLQRLVPWFCHYAIFSSK
jgi:hypothetical protein